VARLYAERGFLRLAVASENNRIDLILLSQFGIETDLRRAVDLDPEHSFYAGFLDTIYMSKNLVFHTKFEGRIDRLTAAVQHAETAIARAKRDTKSELGNTLSISGSLLSFPLSTGLPQTGVEMLEKWKCVGEPWCTDNTKFAPYARPGFAYLFAETFARVGKKSLVEKYLAQAHTEPDYASWPSKAFVIEAEANVDKFIAKFRPSDREFIPIGETYALSSSACTFCHAENPQRKSYPRSSISDLELFPPAR
jgi:hypothetical protein